jgi:hypothetical protein
MYTHTFFVKYLCDHQRDLRNLFLKIEYDKSTAAGMYTRKTFLLYSKKNFIKQLTSKKSQKIS